MKFLAYKLINIIKDSIQAGNNRVNNIIRTFQKIDDKIKQLYNDIVAFLIHAYIRFIKFRIRMTDKYLETKAEVCETALKAISYKRKKIAREQIEARRDLKKLRTTYKY